MGGRQSSVEGVVVRLFGDRYRGRRVLLTGHTGFKGSWLAAWLTRLGADVTCLALDPEGSPNHWDLLACPVRDLRVDIRDSAAVRAAFDQAQPEMVFHLAAQALVRRSYRDPLENWSSNVMGTAHVLDACRQTSSVRAVVVATTDKVYANREWSWGYREVDALGGHDPYSASKAACELLVDSYRKSFWQSDDAPLLATARAGNVIGGGDWSADRLIPDLVRAVTQETALHIRSPGSTRPWQHVLECLSGYLLLGQRLLEGERALAEAWNFGPQPEANRSVADVLAKLQRFWPQLDWQVSSEEHAHEAGLLYLDCAKSRSRLNWCPVLSLDLALEMTADWYRSHHASGQVITFDQVANYIESARAANAVWVS